MNLFIQNCPICNNNNFSLLKSNDRYLMGITTSGCNECGLIQTNPRPTESDLILFYEKEYRKFYQGITSPNENYIKNFKKEERFNQTVEFLMNSIAISSEYKILDIGCSEGTFFKKLRDHGFNGNLFGVEPNKDFSCQIKKNLENVEIYNKIENIKEENINIITMTHVFEHFLQPNITLKIINNILREDGVLYIDVPDADEYNSLNDFHIAHLYHYTTRTLTHLLKINNFDIILCEKYSPLNHPKSIRLLAKKSTVFTEEPQPHDKKAEDETWQKIKNIPIAKNIITNHLKKNKIIYFFYKTLKNRNLF